ncbi:MAG: hypothetical protein CBC16_10860 [Verrucomicrobia bacterium TMED56]|jgi:hypothetical protein|nr:MAG: hypothetical protein CBC16_10860 [Verrucomicrobia bacterium TMED56]|tara:strand:- start:335 stop:559 length:225 start_codon:yes stop_codon:yes gene_type:complete
MGGKSQPQMPPPVDQSVYDKTAEAEAQAAAEKEKMLGSKKKGMYGTILTSGEGLEDEAETSKTVLGGGVKKNKK